MHMTNTKSYELKDLQTFFEVLRLKIIKRQCKKTFKLDQENFSVIQICQVLILLWITRTIMLRRPETTEFIMLKHIKKSHFFIFA